MFCNIIPIWLKKNNISVLQQKNYQKDLIQKKNTVERLKKQLKKAKYDLLILKTNPNLKYHPKFYRNKKLKIFCHFRNLNYNGKRKDLINRLINYESNNNYITWPKKRKQFSNKWV